MNYRKYFKGKKITMMGLGLLGRGLGDAIFLAECGAKLTITDLRDKKTLKPSLEKLKKFKNIKYTLGGHKLEDFEDRDFILKAAGVPFDSEFISYAIKNNIPIEMGASLLCRLAEDVITIGITGTRGKTTTTVLIYKILLKAFNKKSQKIYLAGNVRGVATLPLIKKVKKGDIVVLELDSWQLQGFGDSKISPHIAVFTNFLNDHLNYYKNDLERYFDDKANIFKFQKQNDYLLTTSNVAHLITAKYHGKLFNDPIVCREGDISKDWEIKIPGTHNKENISLAIKVAKIIGVKDEIIKQALEKFKGVEGRLEFVKKYKGISIWNDNNSTTPDATIAALRSFNLQDKKIILIMGGADKNIGMSKLIEEIPKYCKAVFLLPGSGSEKLKNQNLRFLSFFTEVKDLKDAVSKALKLATKDDVLLFSPAFASFGLFKNEYDRNDEFVKLIKNLK